MTIEQLELARINGVLNREGEQAALDFARRTMQTYRKAVLASRKSRCKKSHHASLPEFREGYIRSYLVLRRYVLAAGV